MSDELPILPVSVTISVRTLRRMLAAVLPHAAGDNDIPLSVVSFEISGGRLFLVATDRYTIGVARSGLLDPDVSLVPDAEVLMDARDAAELLRMLEGPGGDRAATLGITADPHLTIDLGEGRMAGWKAFPGRSAGAARFVDWRLLLHSSIASPEPCGLGDGFGFNPPYLARFGIEGDGRHESLMLRWAKAGNGPLTLITRGDWFLGAIMPVAQPAEHAAFNWKSWAAVTAPAAEAVTPDA